jgi:hypothetical protein
MSAAGEPTKQSVETFSTALSEYFNQQTSQGARVSPLLLHNLENVRHKDKPGYVHIAAPRSRDKDHPVSFKDKPVGKTNSSTRCRCSLTSSPSFKCKLANIRVPRQAEHWQGPFPYTDDLYVYNSCQSPSRWPRTNALVYTSPLCHSIVTVVQSYTVSTSDVSSTVFDSIYKTTPLRGSGVRKLRVMAVPFPVGRPAITSHTPRESAVAFLQGPLSELDPDRRDLYTALTNGRLTGSSILAVKIVSQNSFFTRYCLRIGGIALSHL